MSQSKIHSAIEATANVIAGYGVAIASQVVIFPFFGINIPFAANLKIGLWFTAISLVRGYILRRMFNRFTDVRSQI